MSKNNNREFKKKVKYQSSQKEYVLQIKKKCKWCWLLLLLLLPLLLLIPLKKDVKFTVLNSIDDSAASNLTVNFDYTKRDLFDFDSYGFFTRKYPYPKTNHYVDDTDTNGVVIFKNIKYTVYQWLFRNNDITRTYTLDNGCFGLDTTITLFDLKDENTVYLTTYLKDIEFTVVDADDNNEPLEGALVTIEADMLNYKDSMRSDVSGKVYFKRVPLCSAIKVHGSKYGWKDDSFEGNLKDHDKDTLFLKQEKEIVKFYVKDLYTKKPIVGAHGQLFFKADSSTQVGGDAITNINGVGKGVAEGLFQNVHKVKEIRIDVNKKKELLHYHDTSTVDYLGYVRVDRWKTRTDEQKTIYLRPNPKPIIFQNIDCKTKSGLSGIENKVTITKADGSTTGPTTIISDKNGEFSISAGLGDKITIESLCKNSCPNEYESNSTTIVNALYDDLKDDANKRKIPLCPKVAPKVKFRDVDSKTGAGISGVRNLVNIKNGQSFLLISDKDGWFEINKAYECQIISIVADGTSVGYGVNNTKIKDKLYSELMPPKPQNIRDIPLNKKPMRVKFCDVDQDGKIVNGATNDIYINGRKMSTETGGCFYVEAQPNDKIKIVGRYKGQINSTKVDGSKTLQQLQNAGQNARNIPFKEKSPPPCNQVNTSGGDGITINEHDMEDTNLKFTIYYDMLSVPDHMIVYCGRKNNPGKELYNTRGKVSGTGSVRIDLSTCSSTWITVKIIGGNGTSWSYRIDDCE